MKMTGIDISHNNGVIDWEKIDVGKVQFAIIRAGYGTSTVDKQFIANIKGALKRGIHIGILQRKSLPNFPMISDGTLRCSAAELRYFFRLKNTLPLRYTTTQTASL